MHQRKAEMARQADAFIALPGIGIITPWGGGDWFFWLLNMACKKVCDGWMMMMVIIGWLLSEQLSEIDNIVATFVQTKEATLLSIENRKKKKTYKH